MGYESNTKDDTFELGGRLLGTHAGDRVCKKYGSREDTSVLNELQSFPPAILSLFCISF